MNGLLGAGQQGKYFPQREGSETARIVVDSLGTSAY